MSEKEEVDVLLDSMESAWGLIANAYEGNWFNASENWRNAAIAWRDKEWHPALTRSTERAKAKMTVVNECAKHEGRSGDLLGPYDLTDEAWREYQFGDIAYRIYDPVSLYFRKSGSTHRVVDVEGVTHCVPAPGFNNCVLRWKSPGTGVSF